MLAVVKVGTSSITDERGDLDDAAILKLCGDLAAAHASGHRVVLVLSGAIAAGHARARSHDAARPTSARCKRSPRSASPASSSG